MDKVLRQYSEKQYWSLKMIQTAREVGDPLDLSKLNWFIVPVPKIETEKAEKFH